MDLRYFEIHDLLCDAVIALEAGDYPAVAAKLQQALVWVEHDWLATPATLPEPAGPSALAPHESDDDD